MANVLWNPFGTDNYLFSRVVYRKSFEALSEETAIEDRQYHVCDFVRTNGEVTLYHYTVSPLVYGNSYQILNATLATTENIDLTDEQLIDGVMAVAGTRVLVKDQDNPVENGIYYASLTAWTRSNITIPTENLQNAMFVSIDSGTVNGGTAWQVEAAGWNDIGIDDINFVRVLEVELFFSTWIGGESEFYDEIPGPYYATNLLRMLECRMVLFIIL